ncbi:NAD(P)-dependent dehydrogenase (short-subunit alcohol dehydrogenase family) [Arthrobacter stackebrandtii]|uniref:NAD(P)-dependent dehydrogenase (Short-subunit alcohol dehydrogenase family) n=1 Tax=Arthrobacter stackebrandtii TaxID=272161 RepID=A0ABS4Z2D5_9MICC|nr:SDR family oxidoreductase [Arthrobacter stackebrandtii]MBP2414890.1 NAD(P)-dependent dehydrogenase (short-subunit alcohol dehydrogenase family) [Arthrobacter stackebrandtii]PYH00932.1 oxidoreductase [Arthrobacter stackebrandtii]
MNSPLVLIAGGSSAAGVAVAGALLGAGMRVLTVGSDAGRISAAAGLTPGAVPLVCNLADPEDVAELAADIKEGYGPVDGLIHLVGGWRGGAGIAGQSDSDWDFLHHTVLATLRNTSKAFYDDLAASPAGRLAIVSSTTVTHPGPGDANYASIKAAAETWVQAVAAGFAGGPGTGSDATSAGGQAAAPNAGAAVVLVVKALVDDAMRARSPERRFPGFTDVSVLGQAVAGLFDTPAAQLNGARLILDTVA